MPSLKKLLVTGSIVAGGLALLGRRRRGAARPSGARTETPPPSPVDHDQPAFASGIANVDPEPLTQIAGEGIDVEATEAAHTEIPEQRERMPQPGVNVP